jgi:hypothetical protein
LHIVQHDVNVMKKELFRRCCVIDPAEVLEVLYIK